VTETVLLTYHSQSGFPAGSSVDHVLVTATDRAGGKTSFTAPGAPPSIQVDLPNGVFTFTAQAFPKTGSGYGSAVTVVIAIRAPTTQPPVNPVIPSGVFGIRVSGNKFTSTLDGSTIQLIGTNISGLENGGYNTQWAQFGTAGQTFLMSRPGFRRPEWLSRGFTSTVNTL
jgi:hypothetical protein